MKRINEILLKCFLGFGNSKKDTISFICHCRRLCWLLFTDTIQSWFSNSIIFLTLFLTCCYLSPFLPELDEMLNMEPKSTAFSFSSVLIPRHTSFTDLCRQFLHFQSRIPWIASHWWNTSYSWNLSFQFSFIYLKFRFWTIIQYTLYQPKVRDSPPPPFNLLLVAYPIMLQFVLWYFFSEIFFF